MTNDSNPPVGATVVDAMGRPWKIEEYFSGPWFYQGRGRNATHDEQTILVALWRMQQRAEQAEATRDLVTLDNIRLVAELAKLRALAVEAKALLATESYRTAKQPAAHLLFRLAALATPNQEPTP